MAKHGQLSILILFLTLLALNSALPERSSLLQKFIALRRELFPLSIDKERRDEVVPLPSEDTESTRGKFSSISLLRSDRQPEIQDSNDARIAAPYSQAARPLRRVDSFARRVDTLERRVDSLVSSINLEQGRGDLPASQVEGQILSSNANSGRSQVNYISGATSFDASDASSQFVRNAAVGQPKGRKISVYRPYNQQFLQTSPSVNNQYHNSYDYPVNRFNSSHVSNKINDKNQQLFSTSHANQGAIATVVHNGNVGNLSAEQVLELLRRSGHENFTRPHPDALPKSSKLPNKSIPPRPKPIRVIRPQPNGFFDILMNGLRNLPVVGNVMRAQVDPIYRPLLNSLLPSAQSRQSNEFPGERHCFGKIGCFETTHDFYDPIFRPINLPPDTREAINTHYSLYTRTQPEGVPLTRRTLGRILDTSYNPSNPTKFIIHGFLDDQKSTWIKDMVRALLQYGDYNVFAVDWSGGSRVIYHQAVTNIRVVALEISTLINTLRVKLGQDPGKVHVIGHSLGSHMAGYVGERVEGLGRITGLDPAEPFFQYMPPSVRLDPSDANFVDVIHTDADSILTVVWQFTGYGLAQPSGHLDFYPNGGRGQPGCSSLSRIPLTALQDGSGLIEGLDAAEKDAVACNHFRACKLFTASLLDSCSFHAFPCKSYDEFEKAKCFTCDTELGCASLGIHADDWLPEGRENVKMYLSTSNGPHFCQYHYRLTVNLADERAQGGSLRGRLTVTFITQSGELRDFDLTKDSAQSFKRGSSRTFLIRHGEDLSASTDALVTWKFEADVFNPLTFCVLFCTPELELSSVTLTPLDTPSAALNSKRSESSDIVMCHKQGESVIRLDSEKTIKISAEPFCPDLLKTRQSHTSLHNATRLVSTID